MYRKLSETTDERLGKRLLDALRRQRETFVRLTDGSILKSQPCRFELFQEEIERLQNEISRRNKRSLPKKRKKESL